MNYAEFVASRFKGYTATITDIAAAPPSLMGALHAVVGMVGEALEYRFSTSRGNLREELGDFVFYWEAFQVAVNYRPALRTGHAAGFERPGLLQYEQARSEWLRSLGELLDLSKKEMVYAQELDATKSSYRHGLMVIVAESLWTILHFHGLTVDQLQRENMEKLLKRFPTGYSNKAAQERADKPTQVEGQMALHHDPALAAQITQRGQEAVQQLQDDLDAVRQFRHDLDAQTATALQLTDSAVASLQLQTPSSALGLDEFRAQGAQAYREGKPRALPALLVANKQYGPVSLKAAGSAWLAGWDQAERAVFVDAAITRYAAQVTVEEATAIREGMYSAVTPEKGLEGCPHEEGPLRKAWTYGWWRARGILSARQGVSRTANWLCSVEERGAWEDGFDWATSADTRCAAGPA